jgi:putative MATE family efflux protein
MAERVDLTRGNVFKNVLHLAWPMVAGNVLQNAFNVVDMIFVGRLGPSAIAAVALCSLLMEISWTLLIGVTIGTTAMVARFYGAGDRRTAGMTAMQSLSLGVVVSLLLVLFVNFFGRKVLVALGARDEFLHLAVGYLNIVFDGSVTLVLFFLTSAIMRGTGDARSPMLIMAASTVINIALDPLLIFGIWIFPEMGVRGAATATVIAQGTGMVAGLYILTRGHTRLTIDWRRYRLDFNLIWRMLKLAVPGTMQGAVRSVGNLLLMRIVTSFGVMTTAAYGIGLRLDLVVMMPGWALGAAAATLVGQNLGAGQPDRAERCAWIATGLYAALLLVVGVGFFVFSRQIIGLFNQKTGILEIGSEYLRVRVGGYLFLALGLVMASALNGAGDTVFTMFILAFSLLGIQLPLAYFLPRLFGGNPVGIWLAITTATVVQGLAMVYWFRSGRWKRRNV